MAGKNIQQKKNKKTLRSMLRDTEGLTTVEYLIILSVVAILGIAAWNAFGDTVVEQVNTGSDTIGDLPMQRSDQGGSGGSGGSGGVGSNVPMGR